MQWKFVSSDDGRVIEWDGAYVVEPLGYDDLVATNSGRPVSFPLRIRNADVRDSFSELSDGLAKANINTILDTPYTSDVIGLVPGGWLPSMLAIKDRSVLIDRNIVGEVRKRYYGDGCREGNSPDLLDFMIQAPIKVNLLLFALEGNRRRHPSVEETEQQIREACRKITDALPNWIIEPNPTALLAGAVGIRNDVLESFDRDMRLLCRVAPLLVQPTSKRNRIQVWVKILKEARALGLPKASIVVIAALSALVCPQRANPAKRIIKPSHNYSKRDAYNTVSDLLSLELLILASKRFPDLSLTLLTKDRSLALFWVGLEVHGFDDTDGDERPKIQVAFTDNLFPNLTDAEYRSLTED